jgi:NAD(P)-dependent dehydrogenase (short-subunit alcohol dehydrogenase family)
MKLVNQVAVITGGASGIGAASARQFAAEGAKLALIDIDEQALNETAAAIRASGGTVMTQVVDVADGKASRDAVAKIVSEWGRIDVLMTSSGISVGGTVASIDEATWDRVFSINVKGTYLWLHETLPRMIEQGSGSIIMVGSQLAVSSGGGNAAYIASKGAIVSLAKTMAVDHARQGIRVNALMPGAIDTPMSRRSVNRHADPVATRQRWAERHAMGRFGMPEEVARAALFLASEDSSFTTGSLLFVDGGWTAM